MNFEGPQSYDEDNSYEPFDYMAAADKLRAEREAKEAAEKQARLDKAESKKAAKKAREAEKKATKEREQAKKDEAKKTESQQPVLEAEEEIELPEVMTFSEGSEYVDGTINEGTEAVFEIRHSQEEVQPLESSIVKPGQTGEGLAEISAPLPIEREEAIARARQALESVDSEHPDPDTIRPKEELIYDLGAAQDELKDRVNRSWGQQASEQAQAEQIEEEDVLPIPVDTSDPQALTETEPSAEPSTISQVGSWINNRARSLERAVGLADKPEDAVAETKNEPAEVQDDFPPFTPSSEWTGNQYDMTPVTEPIIGSQAESINSQAEQPAIPVWIRDIEAELKMGRLPDLKQWQIDLLESQYPDILKQYRLMEVRAQTVPRLDFESLTPASAEQDLPAPAVADAGYDSQLPMPVSPRLGAADYQSVQESYNPGYRIPESRIFSGWFSNFTATPVIVGGVILGFILILIFGF